MDETIQVTCPNCRARFREKARKLTDGFSRQCPTCDSVIFFNEESPKLQINTAMKAASAMRRRLKLEAAERLMQPVCVLPSPRHSRLAQEPMD